MIYTNTQPSFNLSSEWACHTVPVNGRYEYSIVYGPTEGSATVTFQVSIPEGAVVKRAWLSMRLGSPLSGAAYKRVNGISIPSSGTVELDDISADTTEYKAFFVFKANGIVYEDYHTHSSSLSITNPTINVEYDDGTGDDEPEGDTPGDINRPALSGVHLPRLLDSNLAEIARIAPSNLRLRLNLHPLSTAEMELPPGQPEVPVRAFVELFSPVGSVGIFRVTETATTYGAREGQTVYLEHALTTLSDNLTIGVQAMSGPFATVISTLLEAQDVKHWVLGDCELPSDYEIVYEYSYDNLLQSVISLTNMLPEQYAWEFDMLQYPWVMHLREMTEEDACECRLNRNLTSVQLSMDTSSLCTRLYPFGAGEGTDRISLTSLTGQQYIDADTIDIWGAVSRTLTGEDIYDALTLRDVSERYLDRYKNPIVSVQMDAMDLYAATGETIDRFRLGRVCRLPLPSYGVSMRERVIVTEYPDVFGKPENVTVTLANRLRDASDELAELMREATQSKLIGGTVESTESENYYGGITQSNSLVHYFDITGYGNTLSVRAQYTPAGECRLLVDRVTEVPEGEAESGSVDILRYLASDENGVPTVGEHNVQYFARGAATISVSSKVTIKTIEKR